jgi:hypothetical protein
VITWEGKGDVRNKLFMSKLGYHREASSQNDGRNGGDTGEDCTSGVKHSAMSTGSVCDICLETSKDVLKKLLVHWYLMCF